MLGNSLLYSKLMSAIHINILVEWSLPPRGYLSWTSPRLTHHYRSACAKQLDFDHFTLQLVHAYCQSSERASDLRKIEMATSQQLMVVAAALALVLFVGTADAGTTCPTGFKGCNPKKPGCETCIAADVNNCGDCGKKCPPVSYAVAKCSGGHCQYWCKAGYCNCDKNWTNGCEVHTDIDENNCGKCGTKCVQVANAVTKCKAGKCCEPVCKAGWCNCDQAWANGCEVNSQRDANNCGKCGNKCVQLANAVTRCVKGKCGAPVCKAGWGNCDGDIGSNGCEKDLTGDVLNCGKCGNKCPCTLKFGEPTCSKGKCGQQCKMGWKYDKVKKCCVLIV